jgi:hypothetical protein
MMISNGIGLTTDPEELAKSEIDSCKATFFLNFKYVLEISELSNYMNELDQETSV